MSLLQVRCDFFVEVSFLGRNYWGGVEEVLAGRTLTCVAVGGDGRQAGVVADAGPLDVRLRVGGLDLGGVVRLRGLSVVSFHRVLLRAADGGVVDARGADGVGGRSAGLRLDGGEECQECYTKDLSGGRGYGLLVWSLV